MSEDGQSADGEPAIDYTALMGAALLGVVRQILARTAASGLPGDHHFLLSFGTAEAGVVIPPRLLRQFPDEMTVVLQHQFWGLEVDEGGFSVSLRFGGTPERLFVPWPALRSFADPSVGFGLRLRPEREMPPATAAAPEEGAEARAPRPDKVVDLRAFRRRGGDDDR